jgi:hypothetical protein
MPVLRSGLLLYSSMHAVGQIAILRKELGYEAMLWSEPTWGTS